MFDSWPVSGIWYCNWCNVKSFLKLNATQILGLPRIHLKTKKTKPCMLMAEQLQKSSNLTRPQQSPSSWGLFYRPAPWLCNIADFSLMSWSLVVRLCFQGNLAIERLATSKLFPQLSDTVQKWQGDLHSKHIIKIHNSLLTARTLCEGDQVYKNPQQPAYSKDIMWRRPSVSRAKLNKNGRCGKTKYSSNKQA